MNAWEAVLTILGLAAITLVTRGFFLLTDRELPMPAWLSEALRYAPLAALVAVVVPEILLTQGHLLTTWRDARLPAAAVGALCYWRTRSILGTIVAGTAVLLLFRLGWGW